MTLVNDFKKAMFDRYNMKDMGELQWVLGMSVTRDRAHRTMELNQTAFVDQILDKFGLANSNSCVTPMDKALPRIKAEGKPNKQYMEMVGSILWLAMGTRPDLAYAAQALGRHMNAPGDEHFKAAKHVLRYLKETRELGIRYRGTFDKNVTMSAHAVDEKDKSSNVVVSLHADADWANDVSTRRSTTGYVVVLAGAAVSWKSKLQQTVALSTSEAEYMSACAAAQEAIFQRQLLEDLGFPQCEATVIYEDNTGAIALSENPVSHARSKHIDIKYHFVRQKVATGDIKLVHVVSEDQLADLFTKPLDRVKLEKFRERIMGYK